LLAAYPRQLFYPFNPELYAISLIYENLVKHRIPEKYCQSGRPISLSARSLFLPKSPLRPR